jgi:LPPG:FO 2-phospho-L-lactate transferase
VDDAPLDRRHGRQQLLAAIAAHAVRDFARGLLEVLDAGELVVVANTADDLEVYGVHVSPDPDLLTYWLADQIDPRGYGIRDDTWNVMEALEGAGRPAWFRLGDRDLAMCLLRTELLRAGERLTEAQAVVTAAVGAPAQVLPMSDDPVRTQVKAGGRWLAFQEYMVVERGVLPVEGVELRGIAEARPTFEVLAVLAEAEAILIGPSNPVISIAPILALPGLSEATAGSPAPVVAVSPFVGGHALKGPTELFCAYAGIETSAAGVARAYGDVLDGIVADETVEHLPSLALDTLMEGADDRRRVAAATLDFAAALAG